jgi:phage gpG-like protein
MLEITYNDGNIQTILKRIMAETGNTEPAMRAIGEVVMEISKRSFDNSASPDGTPWDANSEATILQYLEKTGGNYKKTGPLSKKGKPA